LFWLFWRWGLLSYLPRLVLNLNLTAYHCWLNVCNPSYSGGRDQEDSGSKPARAIVPWDSISRKNPSQK
jgi:hypothetical protein